MANSGRRRALAFTWTAGLFLATVHAAESMVWQNLVFPVDEGWTPLDLESPDSYGAAAPDDTHRVIVTVVDLPETPRSFKDLTARAFFFGLKREALSLGPTTDTMVAGCPARRFDMEVNTEAGPLILPTWAVLLDPGIYSISLAHVEDEDERVALIAKFELAPGAAPPPVAGPGDFLEFKIGMVFGALAGVFVIVGIVAVMVILARRGKRAKTPPPPLLPG